MKCGAIRAKRPESQQGGLQGCGVVSISNSQATHYGAALPARKHYHSRVTFSLKLALKQGIIIMRKIIFAAAIATSALGLAACSETATEADDMADAMAADADAMAEEATMMGDDAMDDAMEASDATADEISEAAEQAAAEAEAMMASE